MDYYSGSHARFRDKKNAVIINVWLYITSEMQPKKQDVCIFMHGH